MQLTFLGSVGIVTGSKYLLEAAGLRLLPVSGHLHEKDAELADRHDFSKHKPARSLYTVADAEAALRRFRPIPIDQNEPVGPGVEVTLRRAGHILGAEIVELGSAGITVVFSGDLGRPDARSCSTRRRSRTPMCHSRLSRPREPDLTRRRHGAVAGSLCGSRRRRRAGRAAKP